MRYAFLIFILCASISYGQRSAFNAIDFSKADSVAYQYKGASLKSLPILVHNLTTNLHTDVEKFRAIYTWISTNIENDYNSYAKTKSKRSKIEKDRTAFLAWNQDYTPKVFEQLIRNKKTACTGYAYLVREMASLAEIPCEIIDGHSRTPTLPLTLESLPNHSWNSVQLNGKWYLCDATWSAGQIVFKEGYPEFQFEYHDGYFLAEPSLFIRNHYPLEKKWALLKDIPSFEHFISGPIVYKNAFNFSINPEFPLALETEIIKNERIHFKFSSAERLDPADLVLEIGNGYAMHTIDTKFFQQDAEYSISYKFAKAGLYDVHLKYNGAIIATYIIRVKRK
ncbi:transglutaminase domain-containing protein [Cellulophaga baltica]|uniref:transglutaminase domain-containing protein n=1 Tax=Cellulophaga baltica TaxID=76594 RepID=UPI003F4ABCFC